MNDSPTGYSLGDQGAHPLSAPSIEELADSPSLKWSTFPNKLGLWVAESDFGLAPAVRDSAREAIDSDLTGYLPSWATRDLGKEAARFMERHYGWHISPAQVRPVADVLAALEYTITEFTRPGSAVIVPTPAYMPFLTLPKYLGREITEVPLIGGSEHGGPWVHDLEGIETALRNGAGLVLLCNPHNPLGRVFERPELEGIAELISRFDARVFADEIHAPIRYGDRPHIPFASLGDEAAQISVTATSTSKAFNTPGLKCGQIILTSDQDRERWREMGWFGEHGAGTVGVLAAAAAYRDGDEWLAQFVSALESNRDLLKQLIVEHIPKAQFSAPEGTYLAWIDVSAYGPGRAWGKVLRDEAGIAVVDGRDCGHAGADHIRINFATSQQVIRAAIGRLGSFLNA